MKRRGPVDHGHLAMTGARLGEFPPGAEDLEATDWNAVRVYSWRFQPTSTQLETETPDDR